jgi:hypothetical protein
LGKGLITIEETLAMVFSRRQLIDRDYRSPSPLTLSLREREPRSPLPEGEGRVRERTPRGTACPHPEPT